MAAGAEIYDLELKKLNCGPFSSGCFPREKSNHADEVGSHRNGNITPDISRITVTNNSSDSDMNLVKPMEISDSSSKEAATSNEENQPRLVGGTLETSGKASLTPKARKRPAKDISSHFSPKPRAIMAAAIPGPSNLNGTEVMMDIEKSRLLDEIRDLKASLQKAEKEMEKFEQKDSQKREKLLEYLIENTKFDRKQIRDKLHYDNARIGYWKATGDLLKRNGEVFISGTWKQELDARQAKIDAERLEINNTIKPPKRKIGKVEAKKTEDGFLAPQLPVTTPIDDLENHERRDELLRFRKENLRKMENELNAECERYEKEKLLHSREIRRVQRENNSIFTDSKVLSGQYFPVALLGHGGFSEVWKAFDLKNCQNVALKIHRISSEWSDARRANYVKHAIREKDIHKSLEHRNIAKMFELFRIDNETFCTVLEYCDGNDLDFYLKQHKTLSEKETRLIVSQVVDALQYLNDLKVPIIHYDLKPANILMQSGCRKFEIKITDFGLSKLIDNEFGDSIELTSQGAGTYWYLPPETFASEKSVSTKVDIWSLGIITYECIYGKRPFGNEQNQHTIRTEGTILKATTITFPPKPVLQLPIQDFIKQCLKYHSYDRPDAKELSKHELIQSTLNKKPLTCPPSPSTRLS